MADHRPNPASELAMPLADALAALAHLPAGTALITPSEPTVGVLARAVREAPPDREVFAWLIAEHSTELRTEVLDEQLRALLRGIDMLPGLNRRLLELPQAAPLRELYDLIRGGHVVRAVEQAIADSDPRAAVEVLRADAAVRDAAAAWAAASGFGCLQTLLVTAPGNTSTGTSGRLTDTEIGHAIGRVIAAQLPHDDQPPIRAIFDQHDAETIESLDARVSLESIAIDEHGFSITALAITPHHTQPSGAPHAATFSTWGGFERIVDDLGNHYVIRGRKDTTAGDMSETEGHRLTFRCYPAPPAEAQQIVATSRRFLMHSVRFTKGQTSPSEKTTETVRQSVELRGALYH